MTRLKILYVIPTLDQSGAEKQLALLAAGLPPDRFAVTVCALTRGGYHADTLAAAGVDVRVIGKRLRIDPYAFFSLRRLIREIAPDIVHTWLFAGNFYGRLAALLAGRPHLIASERCVDEWKSSYHFAIDRRLCRWTDLVVANSHAVADFYRRHGIPGEKLRVIPNAIECQANQTDDGPDSLESGALQPPADRGIRTELGFPKEVPLVGFVGRLWPQKRVEDILWAADILRIGGYRARWLIVGAGPRRLHLERLARKLGLESIVHFLDHRSDVPALLAAIDVFVLASDFEGMPNVVLEAMRAARPVVATRIAGMDEVVIDGMTGLLVEPRQPVELAKAIQRLLEDEGLRHRLGESGRRQVRLRFSVAAMVDAYARLYDETGGRN